MSFGLSGGNYAQCGVPTINTPMAQPKTTLKDLAAEVDALNIKYNIGQFEAEVAQLFSNVDLTLKKMDEIVKNPEAIFDTKTLGVSMTDAQIGEYFEKYNLLRKKFNYDDYVKEGHTLRKKFVKSRRDYIFNKVSFVQVSKSKRPNNLELLSIDYSEQYLLSRWMDRMLKKVYPKTVKLSYEWLDGSVRETEIVYKKCELTEDYIEAPLINRVVGNSIFDSFLIHSFYDIREKKWIYVPIKLVMSMQNNALTDLTKFEEKKDDESL